MWFSLIVQVKENASHTSGAETKLRKQTNTDALRAMEADKSKRSKFLLASAAGKIFKEFMDLSQGIQSPKKKSAPKADAGRCLGP